jgi:1-pyrroline-5-carboxylate dehydrogenase
MSPVVQVLGPDPSDVDYVVWQADQDAYAFSGQKCSAQSMLVAHEKWMGLGIVDKLRAQAAKRSLAELTISPVLTWSNPKILEHMNACLKLPGAELAFGGTPLTGHSIPDCYGAMPPTAVYVPIETIMATDANFALATTELFGPFQIITSYKDGQLPLVIQMLNRMQNHLTAGVVSSDMQVCERGRLPADASHAGNRLLAPVGQIMQASPLSRARV